MIYDIDNDPYYKKVIFEIKIPFEAKSEDGVIYKGITPNIKQNIVIFIDEEGGSEFKLKVDTSSYMLGNIIERDNKSYFSFETYIIISVVKKSSYAYSLFRILLRTWSMFRIWRLYMWWIL